MSTYAPQPGTIPHRVLTYLRELPAGVMKPGPVIVDDLDLFEGKHTNLRAFMGPAIRAGLVRFESSHTDRRHVLWGLGDGVPLPAPEEDEPLKPAAAKPRPQPKPIEPLHVPTFAESLAVAPAPACAAPAGAPPPSPTALVPVDPSVLRIGALNDGGLVVQPDGAWVVFTQAQTRALAHYMAARPWLLLDGGE